VGVPRVPGVCCGRASVWLGVARPPAYVRLSVFLCVARVPVYVYSEPCLLIHFLRGRLDITRRPQSGPGTELQKNSTSYVGNRTEILLHAECNPRPARIIL
jgi:hypothetical protein